MGRAWFAQVWISDDETMVFLIAPNPSEALPPTETVPAAQTPAQGSRPRFLISIWQAVMASSAVWWLCLRGAERAVNKVILHIHYDQYVHEKPSACFFLIVPRTGEERNRRDHGLWQIAVWRPPILGNRIVQNVLCIFFGNGLK